MISQELQKQFSNVIRDRSGVKEAPLSKEERNKIIMMRLGIQKHGPGKRKRKNKKKGGRR